MVGTRMVMGGGRMLRVCFQYSATLYHLAIPQKKLYHHATFSECLSLNVEKVWRNEKNWTKTIVISLYIRLRLF